LAVREWLWFSTATKSMNSHRDGTTASLCLRITLEVGIKMLQWKN